MNSQDERIADLEGKLQEMAMELDTMKSSRNYYKDQCESLLVSLASSVQNHVPAYRTQEEVEEMIESIQAQQKAKRQKLKQKYSQQINDFQKTIEQLKDKIVQQEKVIHDQEEVRVGLIEKLMSYKKSLSEANSIQQETEIKLSHLQESESLLAENNASKQVIEEMKVSHTNEVNTLQSQIKKLRKKIKYLSSSLEITQTAQEESKSDVTGLVQQLKEQKAIESQLREELSKEKQIQIDASALLKIAMAEAEQMQKDSKEYTQRIAYLLSTVKEQEATMSEMKKSLYDVVSENQKSKEQIHNQNRDILDFQMKIEEIKQQHEAEIDKYEEEKVQRSEHISNLESHIENLKKEISGLQNDRSELQNELNQKLLEINQENRMRKAAELAKETALTNLKNAYSLMDSNESVRHESNLEIEKLTNDLENKIREHNDTKKKFELLQNEFDISKIQLNSEKEKNQNLSNQLNKVSQELYDIKSNSVWKTEVAEQTDRLEHEKAKLISELKEIQQQYNIQISDNETKEITLRHQEEVLKKSLLELKNVQRQNRILRKKLQQSNFSISNNNDGSIEIDDNINNTSFHCQNCEKLQNQINLLRTKVQKLTNDLSANEITMQNTKTELRDFVSKISEMAISEEISPLFMELRSKLDNNSLTLQQEFVELRSFLIEYIDDVVYHLRNDSINQNDGANIKQSTEVKLLKSTMSHMQNKITALKVQNQLQNDEIVNLKSNMRIVSNKKEETEMKMTSMNESIGVYRKTLDETKRKLSQTQLSKKKPSDEFTFYPNSVMPISNENINSDDSDQDLSDISSVSSQNLKTDQYQITRKAATLSDSLALLDLLCQ
ncbi:hypothetical protein M9Y10_005022 [Tritrichomonas musculus]|uniref:Viral A-type inclusion protein n=1 Tax=Tritrichomonas musculus TaxID=1915356 RepID=A0ABR2JLX8_9EUKA